MKKSIGIDLLIVRKLTNSLSQKERNELEQFVSKSDDNRKYVETYERLWKQGNSSLFHKIDVKEDWQKVRNRMSFHKNRDISPRRIFLKYVAVLIPAFFILAAVSAYYFVPGFGRLTAYNASQKEQIELPDGSVVSLHKGSRLIIIRDLKGKERRVKLNGEAFFTIAKDHSHPFMISVGGVKVEVVGTAFNLENDGKSVRIQVVKGVVKFRHKNEELLVHKGEEAFFNGNSIEKTDIQDYNFMAWKTGVMKFYDAGLKDILNVIADTYDEVSGYKINAESKVKVTTEFDNRPLPEVLEELQIHFNKKFVLHDGILVISD